MGVLVFLFTTGATGLAALANEPRERSFPLNPQRNLIRDYVM